MKIDKREFDAAKALLVDEGTYAPVDVIAAAYGLVRPDRVQAAYAQRTESGGVTTWHGLWLTAEGLLVVTGSRAAKDWDLGSDSRDRRAESVEAWMVPISDVRSVSVLDAQSFRDNQGADFDYLFGIDLKGRDLLILPFDQQFARYERRDSLEGFVTAVREAVERGWDKT